jgi:hypothetical protein
MFRLCLLILLLVPFHAHAGSDSKIFTLLDVTGVSSTQTGAAVSTETFGGSQAICTIDVTACSSCSIASWSIQTDVPTTLGWVDYCKSSTAIGDPTRDKGEMR